MTGSIIQDPRSRPAARSLWGLHLWQCICIYGAMAYANSFAAWNLVSPAAEAPKLFDQGHYWLPEVSKNLPDTLFFTLYIVFLVRWRHRHDILRPFFLIASALFFLRLLTFTSTLVPPASPDIYVVKRGGPWVFLALYSQNTSTDYMFSAHTFHLTLFTVLSLRNSRWWTDRFLIPIVALTAIIFVVASRLHYTSDVLVGFILTLLMFATYELVETNRRLVLALSRSRAGARRRAVRSLARTEGRADARSSANPLRRAAGAVPAVLAGRARRA